jgi:phosphopantothenoylcysteine decarboxylase/phosphopantothenate--cysteine ligase
LKKDGMYFVEPVEGELACKTVGTGKLEDVENIVAQALSLLESEKERKGEGETRRHGGAERETGTTKRHEITRNIQPTRNPQSKDFLGEKVLITVGGTREAIDPVRFISNHSSGKMGFAVAQAASERGADVTVVAGVTTVEPPENIKLIRAVSAAEMHKWVMQELPNATVFIGAAAVADYAPANAADAKIKKDGRETMTLELRKTPDILSDVAASRTNGLMVVGFAAETDNVIEYARSKMEKKNLDMVVANDITQAGAGFNTDTNIATILVKDGQEIKIPLTSKADMANQILDEIVKLRTVK